MTMLEKITRTELDGDFTVHTVPGYVESDDALARARTSDVLVEGEVFKAAMRVLAGAVVMVTTRLDERPWGLTISSCCSLSVEPPQILVSLREAGISCEQILETKIFGVSILGREHKELAEHGAAVGAAKFVDDYCEGGDSERLEAPAISGALFHLDCAVQDTRRIADHQVIIGLVKRALAARSQARPSPLIYFDRAFWALGERL